MLLTIKRDILLKPLVLTTGFVEKKQTMPILANVYIKKHFDQITVIANDLEIQASITSQGEMSGDDFTITMPAKKLQDILKVFSHEAEVVFERQDNKIQVTAGNTKFNLQSLPAEHYPLLKITEQAICQFSISQQKLKNMLGQIQYAMADKDSRVFLNGMLFEIKDNNLRLVATDAHRLGFVSTEIHEQLQNTSSIIPRKTILELFKLLDDTDETITIKMYPNQVVFEADNKQIITKIIDGKYPDYERVIPLGNDKLCLINREEFLKAVERVSVIGIDKLKTVTLEAQNNRLSLSCRNEEQEDSKDEIEVNYQATESIKVSFNISFIRDLLLNTHAPELQWAFYDSQRSVLVTIPNNYDFKSVIMPLRT